MAELLRIMKKLLITIDGPAGAGKTTVSRMLADRLGYRVLRRAETEAGPVLLLRRDRPPAGR